jgi:putative acyl-CoA dehydrogenase
MPLNSIWEGSGNIMCLDVLRALGREPLARDALMALLQKVRGSDARYDRYVAALGSELSDPTEAETRARRLTERIALAVQAAILIEHGSPSAGAFLASRIASGAPGAFGTLPAGLELDAIIDRTFTPQMDAGRR